MWGTGGGAGKGCLLGILALGAGGSQDPKKRDQFSEEQSWGQWGTLSTGWGVLAAL